MDSALFFTRRSIALTCMMAMITSFLVIGASSSVPVLANHVGTYTVNTGEDAPDTNPGNNVCEGDFEGTGQQTPTAGTCTLRAAVMESNADTGHNTINFTETVTAVTLNIAGTDDSAAAGDLDITDDLHIQGDGVVVTQTVEDRVFHVLPGPVVTIQGTTVQGGTAGDAGGGGIRNESELHFQSGTVTGNAATGLGDGGGIYNNTDGLLTVTGNSLFVDNDAANEGGGIFNSGQLTSTDTDFRSNNAIDGGGLFNDDADAYVLGGSFITNTAFGGGGIYNFHSADDGDQLVLEEVTVGGDAPGQSNEATYGGGILNSGLLTVLDGTVEGNRAVLNSGFGGSGGGVFNVRSPDDPCTECNLIMDGTTVTANAAENDGGGISSGVVSGDPIGRLGGSGTGANMTLTEVQVSDNVAGSNGGGFYASFQDFFPGSVSVTASVFEGNQAQQSGGGWYQAGGNGDIIDSDFLDNEAGVPTATANTSDDEAYGGGLYLQTTDITYDGGIVEGNEALLGEGGGIWNRGSLDLLDVDVDVNRAAEGGGIYNGSNGVMTVREVDITENVAQGFPDEEDNDVDGPRGAGEGGGIWNDASILIELSTMEGNVADDATTGTAEPGIGGGLYQQGGTSTISGTSVTGNEAGEGAGTYYGVSGTHRVDHSLFNANVAEGDGGGIWNDTEELAIVNSTLSGNEAGGVGGGLFNLNGDVTSTANTIYQNEAEGEGSESGDVGGNVHDVRITTVHYRQTIVADGVPQNCNEEGGHSDEGYNLDDDGTCFAEPNETGTIVGDDAELEELDDNGGPTLTHALFRNSPALDAVPSEDCSVDDDQRYFERPADEDDDTTGTAEACDIGAFEHQEGEDFPSTGGGGGSSRDPDCEDGIDNDDDDLIDEDDPGCSGENDETEDSEGSPSPSPSPSPSETDDGDGDGDGDGGPQEARCREAAEMQGMNLVSGTNGDDVLRGTSGPDLFCAKGGDDEMHGLGGNDVFWMSAGNDYAEGDRGDDTFRGGRGRDEARGGRGADVLTLGQGRDHGVGGRGDDSIFGHAKPDRLKGGRGDDDLHGGGGRDQCNGGVGNDTKESC